MAGRAVRFCVAARGATLLACPICAVPEGTRMSEGARAGALTLIAVTAVVVIPMIVWAVRLWRAEREER